MGNLYHVLHKLSLVIKSNLRQRFSEIALNPIFEILESGYTNTIITSVVYHCIIEGVAKLHARKFGIHCLQFCAYNHI